MPTSDYSNTTRTARIRQAAISVGVSKIGNSTSSSMHMARVLGGVPIKIKNSAGLSLNNVPVDTSGKPLISKKPVNPKDLVNPKDPVKPKDPPKELQPEEALG